MLSVHTVVGVSDAVVDPGAVVVHLLDAAAALAAVVRPRNLEPAANLQCIAFVFPPDNLIFYNAGYADTYLTPLQAPLVLLLLGPPAERDVPGAVERGRQEVVQRQDGQDEQG